MAGARASIATRDRIRERWNLEYSEYERRWGNPERECWAYVERREDWVPESETVACEQCSDIEEATDCTRALSWGSRPYSYNPRTLFFCETCYNRHTFVCESCDERVCEDDLHEIRGNFYCPPCAAEHHDEDEDDGGEIAEYHSTSRPNPYGIGIRGNDAYSIELELELPDADTRDSFIAKAKALPYKGLNSPIFERDGSLDRAKGVECIFSLYTDKEALLHDIELLQSLAREMKGIAWDLPKHGREAGIHISTNRIENGWSKRNLARLGFILTVCREELAKAAGRVSHFAPYPTRKTIEDMQWRPLMNFANGHLGKYCAVNVREERLEWRIFRSTLNRERLRLNLNLVCELENLAKGNTPACNLASVARLIIANNTKR